MNDPAQATATVTITISRDAAEWVYREISGDNALTPTPFHLCSEAEAAFSSALGIQHPVTQTTSAVGTLVTALTVASPPAPSELEQDHRTDPCHYCGGSGYVSVDATFRREPSRKKCLVCDGAGVTLRQAIAAGRSAGEGTSDE